MIQKLSKSQRIFIRREKNKIRKNISNKEDQKKQIIALYGKFGSSTIETKEVKKDTKETK